MKVSIKCIVADIIHSGNVATVNGEDGEFKASDTYGKYTDLSVVDLETGRNYTVPFRRKESEGIEIGSMITLSFEAEGSAEAPTSKIFSGDESAELWKEINTIDEMSTGADIHGVIYSLACKMQELEAKTTGAPCP